MRRGTRGRGYGYNRPPQRPQNQNRQTSGGPMMTNHLLGLKDIDMELELLKRKREIIEEQQQMLSNTYRPRNDYEQPMFNQSRNNRYDDYTRLYDDPRESDHYGGGGGGSSSRKRTHVQVWENESPPKRFTAPSRGVKKAFGSRLGPPPQNSRQDYQPRPAAPKPFKRPAQSGPPQKKKEFNPTKVTKHSAGPPPMKLASYQPAERKKLVTEAIANSAVTVSSNPAASAVWVLRADCEPSRQVVGRLELALGAIMKDLKHANPEYEELFKAPAALRAMKQAVRERLRSAMMGKVVSTCDLIKATYHETFPSTDGNDIVMKGLEAQTSTELITIKSDDPEVYFKKNMYRLMSLKLEEMTNKLQEIYCGKNRGFIPKKKRMNPQKLKTQNGQAKTDPESNHAQPQTGESQTQVENTQPEAADESQTANIESKTDEAQSNGETAESELVRTEEPTANTDASNVVTDDTRAVTDDSQAVTGDSNAVIEEVVPNAEVSTKEAPRDVDTERLVSLEQYKAFDKLMNIKMIQLIKKYSPAFLKAMDVDAMFRKTKGMIMNETRKKLGVNTEVAPHTEQNSVTKKTSEKRFLTPLQYYVKIIGKPSLPKRKAMESFFEEFKPKSVKKHKNIYNLLFVGFAEKEPYEKILAANGTVIGRNTLDIKVSERNDKKNQNNPTSPIVTIHSSKSEQNLDESGSEVIGADLDEQITDLLTSIRQGEEDSFSDDVVMYEFPPNVDQNDVKEENEGETVKLEPDVACDAVQGSEMIDITDKRDDDVVEIKDVPKNDEVVEIKDDQEKENNEAKVAENEEAEKKDTVQALKTEVNVKGTPTRTSARLSAPGGIRTRRMSKLE